MLAASGLAYEAKNQMCERVLLPFSATTVVVPYIRRLGARRAMR